MNAWAGGQIIHEHVSSIHHFVHWIADNIPGGWATVLGFLLLGFLASLWLKFHKFAEQWIGSIVRRQMERRAK